MELDRGIHETLGLEVEIQIEPFRQERQRLRGRGARGGEGTGVEGWRSLFGEVGGLLAVEGRCGCGEWGGEFG